VKTKHGIKNKRVGCIKVRCYWEHSWRTHWELREPAENMMRTQELNDLKRVIRVPPEVLQIIIEFF
jgi:hypothetical protein